MDFSPDIKTLLDIGLGAVSLMLWLRQGKVNKMQLLLDEKQNKATEDLTVMVRDHEDRIVKLEQDSLTKSQNRRKPTKLKVH